VTTFAGRMPVAAGIPAGNPLASFDHRAAAAQMGSGAATASSSPIGRNGGNVQAAKVSGGNRMDELQSVSFR
jgi:hypothetical protein